MSTAPLAVIAAFIAADPPLRSEWHILPPRVGLDARSVKVFIFRWVAGFSLFAPYSTAMLRKLAATGFEGKIHVQSFAQGLEG